MVYRDSGPTLTRLTQMWLLFACGFQVKSEFGGIHARLIMHQCKCGSFFGGITLGRHLPAWYCGESLHALLRRSAETDPSRLFFDPTLLGRGGEACLALLRAFFARAGVGPSPRARGAWRDPSAALAAALRR